MCFNSKSINHFTFVRISKNIFELKVHSDGVRIPFHYVQLPEYSIKETKSLNSLDSFKKLLKRFKTNDTFMLALLFDEKGSIID